MKRRFECIACGRVETLTMWPDCCSSCGSSMSLLEDTTVDHDGDEAEMSSEVADAERVAA